MQSNFSSSTENASGASNSSSSCSTAENQAKKSREPSKRCARISERTRISRGGDNRIGAHVAGPGQRQRSMPPRILTYELQQQYEALRALLQRAVWLAERCADYEATQILRARLTNLQSPALLVFVGEVKAGKSSFINALLHAEICEA